MRDKSADTSDASPRRKTRFTPKVSPRKPRVAATESEKTDEDSNVIDSALLRRLKQPREDKSKPQVKSGVIAISSSDVDNSAHARSFGSSKGSFFETAPVPLWSSGNSSSAFVNDGSGVKDRGKNLDHKDQVYQKAYKASENSWGICSYPPITLPLGNPEKTAEGKHGGASISSAQNEVDVLSPAEKLGLIKIPENSKTLFIQLPGHLPLPAMQEGCSLKEIPQGCIGKMLVYKNGKVKMKIGEVDFDVSSGMDLSFSQDLMAINSIDKHCCNLGGIDKRIIVTPDLGELLLEPIDHLPDGGGGSEVKSKLHQS